jgi:hypothetical protein
VTATRLALLPVAPPLFLAAVAAAFGVCLGWRIARSVTR